MSWVDSTDYGGDDRIPIIPSSMSVIRNKFKRLRADQCWREILFLFDRLFRDISRNEDLIAIFISRYIINIYYQL